MNYDYENDAEYGDYLYDSMRDRELDDALNRKDGQKMYHVGERKCYTWSEAEQLWIED